MRKILPLLAALVMVFGLTVQAQATLFLQGTDILGNQLIYDDDLDITWYDFTNAADTWSNQTAWASGLTVNFGDTFFTDWRLPTALNQDGTGPCLGFDCTDSEMGRLFFTELGNAAFFSGCTFGTDCGLANTGPFNNMQADFYWSGREFAPDRLDAWDFNFSDGFQTVVDESNFLFAWAVRPGNVSAVPEPSTFLLLGSGLAGLIGYGRKKGRSRG